MKASSVRFWFAGVGIACAVSTTGCEQCQVSSKDGSTTTTKTGFCSVNRFEGSSSNKSATLGDGKNVTIKSRHGNLTVTTGSGGDVTATFHPFVYRAFHTQDSEIQTNFGMLVATVTADADGNITVSTTRKDGAPSTLGADIDVQIPSSFAGAFTIDQDNGETDVKAAGNPTAVSITSSNGGIRVAAGSSAATVYVKTDNGDVAVGIGAVPDGAPGGTISTAFGSLALDLPGGGKFSVPATADTKVDFGSAPSACTSEDSAVNSKTLTCNGGGAVFTAKATGPGATVTATYH